MKRLFLISFIFLSYCTSAQYDEDIEKNRKIYAPDKRTVVFEISYNAGYNSIRGKTNSLEAKKALSELCLKRNVIDSIQFLPAKNNNLKKYGIVHVSVANLRTKPEESAELASQILMGMPLRILEKNRGWYRVQCPDDYIGWIDGSTMTQFSENEYAIYQSAQKAIFTKPFGFALNDTSSLIRPVRDLSFGNLLTFKKIEKGFAEVIFPDGKTGFIPANEIQNSEDWLKTRKTDNESLVNYAYQMIGIPYLWGGTSFKGADCSGFTRMTFLAAGMLLPRDASQQALLGETVSIDYEFTKLSKGDVLFFGNLQTSKVTHVAIWAGDKSFIHSSGMIQVNSFDINSPNYDEYNLKRLLFVKRIDHKQLYLSGKNFYKF
ncbi:MAG: C40 family peptidase [Leadbetterella sp.]|nr:C40 family peptidase [Leadbetterella sp.]